MKIVSNWTRTDLNENLMYDEEFNGKIIYEPFLEINYYKVYTNVIHMLT